MPEARLHVALPALRVSVVVLSALVVVVTGGCVADASGDQAVSTTYPAPVDSVPEAFADIEAIMPTAPPGFLREPDLVADAGPTDLEAAVLDEGRGDSLQTLAEAGFVRGYQRRFVDTMRTRRIDVWLFELGSVDAAAAHVLRDVADGETDGELIEVTRVPDAYAWRHDRPDSSTVRAVLARGPYFVRVEAVDPDPDAATERALDVAATMHTVLEPMAAGVLAPPATS